MRLSSLFLIPLSFILLACQDDNKTSTNTQPEPETLVTVNQQAITAIDLDVMTEKMFARDVALAQGQQLQEKALESMVMMLLIAQAGERQASTQELAEIDAKTQRYREELLAEMYLRNNANVAPPTAQDIQQYYSDNKALFGEKDIHYFELVRTTSKPKAAALKNQLEILSTLNQDNWLQQTASLKQQTRQYEVVSANTALPNLSPSLLRSVNALAEGEVSKVIMINQNPHVVRKVKTLTKEAAPLAEVRDRIRRTLAAKKLKEQVKTVSQTLMQQADIVYANANAQ